MEISQDILNILEDHPSGLSISEIAKKSNYHRNTISPRLTTLSKEGKIKVKKTGRAKVYYLKDHAMIAEGGKQSKSKNKKNIFVGVGISKNKDSYLAAKEAVEMAIKNAGKKPEFALVFAGSNYDLKKLNKGLSESLDCEYVGSTTAGELSNYGFTKHSCVIMTIYSDYMDFGIGIAKGVLKNPEKATSKALNQSLSNIKFDRYVTPYINFTAMRTSPIHKLVKMRPYFVFTITPGLGAPNSVNNDKVISTINRLLGSNIPILGVGSASDEIFVNKFLFTRKGVFSDAIITVFAISDLKIGFGLAHGLKPMKNKVCHIHEQRGNEVITLDNENAANRYKELTGVDLEKFILNEKTLSTKQGQKFLSHPFAIQTLGGNYIIRHLLAEKPQKTLRFCFSIPEKAALIPMEGKAKQISNATVESIKLAKKDAGSENIAAVIGFSCLLRQMLQGKATSVEVDKLKKHLKDTPFIGFYGVGEIASFPDSPTTSQQMSFESVIITDTLINE